MPGIEYLDLGEGIRVQGVSLGEPENLIQKQTVGGSSIYLRGDKGRYAAATRVPSLWNVMGTESRPVSRLTLPEASRQ
ncbi:MAG: hypothetical protein ACLFPV_09835 [Spirochaetaceae bacterium]